VSKDKFEVLDGLPPYGPAPLPFPESGYGAFREGLVVRFHQAAGGIWTGNFQRPSSGGYDCVIGHPDHQQVIVIAGGQGYFVDPELRRQTHKFGGAVSFAQHVPDLNVVLIGDATSFAAFSADGLGWNSERISWGGVRNIVVGNVTLCGEAWSPVSENWHPFELDLLTGRSNGAIYENEIKAAVRISP
jgi:hypothetical protein